MKVGGEKGPTGKRIQLGINQINHDLVKIHYAGQD